MDSITQTPDGQTALRVEVRSLRDGRTAAMLHIADDRCFVAASVPTPAYDESEAVQAAFLELVKVVVHQMIREAIPEVAVLDVKVVAPGAPLDATTH